MPVSVTVGAWNEYTFAVAGDTVRITAHDAAVMTLTKEEWLTVVGMMAVAYRPEIAELLVQDKPKKNETGLRENPTSPGGSRTADFTGEACGAAGTLSERVPAS